MDGELLSLKWNNHRTTFYHVISGLRNKESYTDVTLACDGKFYPVHKLVLSTCSEYFSDIFERTNCKNPVVILKDIQCSDLEFLLDYMYIGEVNVRQRPEQQSPPPKRRRTEERRNTDHSPGRPPEIRRGSSSSVNSEIRDINPARDINPSQRSDDPPTRRDQNSSSDKVVGTPVVQEIKLEKDDEDQDIYIQSNSFDGGGDGPDTEGDSATDFPEFLQSSIEKEEPVSMSDYNPSDFAGPSGLQNSGVPPWDGDSSGFTESLSGAVAAAVAAAQQPGQQQQQQLVSGGSDAADISPRMGVGISSSLDTVSCNTCGVVVVSSQWHSHCCTPHSQGSLPLDASQSSQGFSLIKFQCPFCSYSTNDRSNYRRHSMLHSGEKNYVCPTCGRRFNDCSNMKKHSLRCIPGGQNYFDTLL